MGNRRFRAPRAPIGRHSRREENGSRAVAGTGGGRDGGFEWHRPGDGPPVRRAGRQGRRLGQGHRTKLGVKPVAPPPIHGPNLVADAILRAAEHPARDIAVRGAAKALILGQRLSPRLVDALLQRGGFEVHYTDEPKTEDAPDNLYASLGYDAVEGSFGGRAHPGSLYTWLELRPTAKGAAVTGATLGALALLRARS